ncbi:MAG: hypothetical protein GYA57_09400 [Myxococcales bacterium]|nr:hypothetical protein [Myxococcales bacterium]
MLFGDDRARSGRRRLPAVVAALLAAAGAPAGGCRGERAASSTATVPAAADSTPETPAAPPLDAAAAPAAPVEATPIAGAPEPGLAAHLSRVPEGPGRHVVLRVDLRGLATRPEIRAAARRLLGPLDAAGSTDAACLAELLGAVDAVTYVWRESDGPDTGIALIDAAVGLPAALPCLRSLGLVPPAPATLDDGPLALAPQISIAAAGDGTVAVGATELVQAACSGSPPRPLSRSAALERARALAGAAPVWVAWFEPDGTATTGDLGGFGLRIAPRLGVTGTLVFAGPGRAEAFRNRAVELLAGLHRAGESVLQKAEGLLPAADLAPLRAVLDAARDASFTLDAGTLAFETWFPPELTLPELLGALPALAPILDLL